MIIHSAPQGSDQWLESRRGVITASRFKDARDVLKSGKPSEKQLGYAMDVARERAGGLVPAVFVSGAMRTGTDEEPRARAEYQVQTGELVIEAGFITTDDGRFGVSVDGLVGDDGVLEIKTMVSSKTLFKALADGDTSDYIDQCNAALWLLGRKWVDLVLWAPDLSALRVIRIHRDEEAIAALESDLMVFKATVDDYEAALRQALRTTVITAQEPTWLQAA